MSYSHTQRAPFCLLVYGTALALFIGALFTHEEPPIALILTDGDETNGDERRGRDTDLFDAS